MICRFCIDSVECLCKGRCKNRECECPTKKKDKANSNYSLEWPQELPDLTQTKLMLDLY